MPSIKIPLVFKIAASVLLLLFVFSKVDISSLLDTLSESDLYLLLPAIASTLVSWFINTYKWQVLLKTLNMSVPYKELLRLNFIGLFYNLVVPGQVGGEVVKGMSLAQKGAGKMTAAVSVVSDRFTSLLALFMLGMAGVLLSPAASQSWPELLPWLIGLTLVFAVATALLLTGREQTVIMGVGRVLRIGRLGMPAEGFAMPARSLSSMWFPLLLSIVVQAAIVLTNLLVCLSLGIQITYVQLLWIVAVVSLLQSLPISFAGIGVREGAYVYLLQQQGVAGSSALALSLVVFAIQVMMAAVGGFLQLHKLVGEKRTS